MFRSYFFTALRTAVGFPGRYSKHVADNARRNDSDHDQAVNQ
jgi:hypothetical protein